MYEITAEMQEMVSFIESHGVEVVSTGSRHVSVTAVCTDIDGKVWEHQKNIPARWADIRDWLGY